jgi:oxalate decarboxylase
MKSQSLALLGLFVSSVFAVPGVKRHDGGSDQPISGTKGAPILG